MKTRTDADMEEVFLEYMDCLSDIIDEDISDEQFFQRMRDSVESWNELENDNIDPHEGVMFWVRKTWKVK
jgi:hypothetical protein